MKYKSQEEKNSAYFINQATSPKSSYPYTGLTRPKGLAKLGKIVAETLLRMQMFPSLAARETCVAETNFAARQKRKILLLGKNKKKMFLPGGKNIFASQTQILRPKQKHMFPSLATPGNIARNIVPATMFPSLARLGV